MSHVAAQQTKAGQPLYVDLNCLIQAANLLGLEKIDTNQYRWWGHHVGDFPIPAGTTKEELGSNALFVLRMTEDKQKELSCHDPYDIGVLADPNNPGCYTLIYDFYGQYDKIDRCVGSPVRDENGISMLCPKLKQSYDMVCDAQAAREAGDRVEFLTFKQAHEKYPQMFPASTDETTWVSIVNTEERVGIR